MDDMHRKAVRDRLGLMHTLSAHDTIAPLIRRVVKAYRDSDSDDEAIVRAIGNDLAERLRYRPHQLDVGRFPESVLATGHGDAEDLALVVAACFKALAFPVQFRVLRTRGRPYFHHVHVQVGVPAAQPTKWITVNLSAPHESIFDVVDCDEHLDL